RSPRLVVREEVSVEEPHERDDVERRAVVRDDEARLGAVSRRQRIAADEVHVDAEHPARTDRPRVLGAIDDDAAITTPERRGDRPPADGDRRPGHHAEQTKRAANRSEEAPRLEGACVVRHLWRDSRAGRRGEQEDTPAGEEGGKAGTSGLSRLVATG